MKKLEFKQGWMGGSWFLDNKQVTIKDFNDPIILKIEDSEITANVDVTYGSDYVHGHYYNWVNIDFILNIPTPLGDIKKSLISYMKENKIKFVYVKEI